MKLLGPAVSFLVDRRVGWLIFAVWSCTLGACTTEIRAVYIPHPSGGRIEFERETLWGVKRVSIRCLRAASIRSVDSNEIVWSTWLPERNSCSSIQHISLVENVPGYSSGGSLNSLKNSHTYYIIVSGEGVITELKFKLNER